jgi:hypothetical protein
LRRFAHGVGIFGVVAVQAAGVYVQPIWPVHDVWLPARLVQAVAVPLQFGGTVSVHVQPD